MVARGLPAALVVAAFLTLTACGEFRPIGPNYHYTYYKVQRADTLYSIAFRFGYDYREVAAWNNILPPYIIHAGDELLILDPSEEVAMEGESESGAAAAQRPATPRSVAPKAESPKPKVPARHPPKEAAVRVATSIKWSWPTQGKVAASFAAQSGRKGVDLAGNFGQPVKAAADGDVVYSGSGLIGYGNLVIIKHDETFLSAYGHNRKLLVKEGDKVRAGQAIGEMGRRAKSGSILHFEIRRNGKPVDPLLYLPNQT